jgi:SAM-dependent methyltransferase
MYHPTYNIISGLIKASFPSGELKVLDYGCGTGFILDTFPDERLAYYEGYDINSDSIRYANARYVSERTRFFKIERGDLPKIDRSRRMDVVISIGVLQYMSDAEIEEFLNLAKDVLQENGLLVVSCSVDHLFYRLTDIYRIFMPHRFISRERLIRQVSQSGLSIVQAIEKGIFLSPIFSGLVCLFFDVADKMIWKKCGSMGPIGKTARSLLNPLLRLEFMVPVDYGYTLFIKAKNGESKC